MDDSTFIQLRESNYYHPEITEMVDGIQMSEISWHSVNISEKGYDIIWDKLMANFLDKYFRKGLKILENRANEMGLKTRLILEIMPDNMDFVNSLRFSEIRHLDNIRGNFGIFDKRAYMVQIFHRDTGQPDQGFWSNSKALVQKQQILFDNLWETAMPLSLRKEELIHQKRQDHKRILTDYNEIQHEIKSIVEHSKKELLVFSSVKLIYSVLYGSDFLNKLIPLLERGVIVKILVDDINQDLLNQIIAINKLSRNDPILLGHSNNLGNFDDLVIVSDSQYVLQIKYDNNKLMSLFSNEKHSVFVQEILFEKYWNEVKSLEGLRNN